MSRSTRVCIVYDCLFPWTHGGAERWYRNLADELVRADFDVTYLTRLQWPDDDQPDIEGVEVVAVAPGGALYDAHGRRRIGPPMLFGFGVFAHLVRNRRRYDIVHLCSFPYFALIGARIGLLGSRTRVGVDWFEVWSATYWREYLGSVGGRVGGAIQGVCARLTPQAFVYSELTASRLRAIGVKGAVRLPGLYAGDAELSDQRVQRSREASVVFVGRHIPEKRVRLVPAAIAASRDRIPYLRGAIYGSGPETEEVRAEIDRLSLDGVIELPGFVDQAKIDQAMRTAMCLLLPSAREGYGLVVVEAAAFGTPVVVVAGEDNAAAELVSDGINGFVAPTPSATDIADAIVKVYLGGESLRVSTATWFTDNATRLSADASIEQIIATYKNKS